MASPPGSSDPVARLVIGYLFDRIREVEGADPDLLDRALELYRLIESGGPGGQRPDLEGLRRNATFRGLVGLLGGRAQRLADVGLAIAADNRTLMTSLRQAFEERGIDPADPARRDEAVALYERLLAASVPLDRSLQNVAAIADTIDLANDLLNPRSAVVRGLLPSAIQALLPAVVRDPEVRRRVEALRLELTGQPERLATLGRLVRHEGPGIVRAAYRRGGGPDESVVASDHRRNAE